MGKLSFVAIKSVAKVRLKNSPKFTSQCSINTNLLQFLDALLHFGSSQWEAAMVASVFDQQLCSCVCTNRCSGRRKGTLREGLSDKYSVFQPTQDQQSHHRCSSTTVSTMFFGANLGSTNSLKIAIIKK